MADSDRAKYFIKGEYQLNISMISLKGFSYFGRNKVKMSGVSVEMYEPK